MLFDTSTTGDHVTLLINQPDLPADDQQREAFLTDLEAAVETVLADHGLDADRLRTFGGHTYTSIEADCPECGDRLHLIEPTLGPNNGAFATASCECGWHGEANYRLIDLEEIRSGTKDDETTPDSNTSVDILEESSSVRLHGIQPIYTPY
jgi:hypothetical protein